MGNRKWKPMTDEEFDRQYKEAIERGRRLDQVEPLAVAARYDADSARIVVDLKNGAQFAFLAETRPSLRGASAEELAEVEVSPAGIGLHWETLDADLLIVSLLRNVFRLATPAEPAHA